MAYYLIPLFFIGSGIFLLWLILSERHKRIPNTMYPRIKIHKWSSKESKKYYSKKNIFIHRSVYYVSGTLLILLGIILALSYFLDNI